jgi:hypothetical protein
MGHHYLWGSKQLNLAYSTIYGQYTGEAAYLLSLSSSDKMAKGMSTVQGYGEKPMN